MGMKFYSDIELNFEGAQTFLSTAWPLTGGTNIFNIINDPQNNHTLDLNSLLHLGRYYCNSSAVNNTYITKFLHGPTLLTENAGGYIFEVIISDRIGLTNSTSSYKYWTQLLRVYGGTILGVDPCRIEFKRHYTYSNGEVEWGDWQQCIFPAITNAQEINLGNLFLLPDKAWFQGSAGGNVEFSKNGDIDFNGSIVQHTGQGAFNLINNIKQNSTNISDLNSRLENLGFSGGSVLQITSSNVKKNVGCVAKMGKIIYGWIEFPSTDLPGDFESNESGYKIAHFSDTKNFLITYAPTQDINMLLNINSTNILICIRTTRETWTNGSRPYMYYQSTGYFPGVASSSPHKKACFWYVVDDDFEPNKSYSGTNK